MVFKIPFTGDPYSILRKIQEEAYKQGMLFEGTTGSGRFAGRGIVGRYWLLHPQEITIQVDKKTLLLTEYKIKEEIQRYLEGLY